MRVSVVPGDFWIRLVCEVTKSNDLKSSHLKARSVSMNLLWFSASGPLSNEKVMFFFHRFLMDWNSLYEKHIKVSTNRTITKKNYFSIQVVIYCLLVMKVLNQQVIRLNISDNVHLRYIAKHDSAFAMWLDSIPLSQNIPNSSHKIVTFFVKLIINFYVSDMLDTHIFVGFVWLYIYFPKR